MKVIFVKDKSTFDEVDVSLFNTNPLVIGTIYDTIHIMNDYIYILVNGKGNLYPSKWFISMEEHRDIKLGELGI